ncbi:hypothetical protein FAIPA1_60208 [Frankia sp. AiPs1]
MLPRRYDRPRAKRGTGIKIKQKLPTAPGLSQQSPLVREAQLSADHCGRVTIYARIFHNRAALPASRGRSSALWGAGRGGRGRLGAPRFPCTWSAPPDAAGHEPRRHRRRVVCRLTDTRASPHADWHVVTTTVRPGHGMVLGKQYSYSLDCSAGRAAERNTRISPHLDRRSGGRPGSVAGSEGERVHRPAGFVASLCALDLIGASGKGCTLHGGARSGI